MDIVTYDDLKLLARPRKSLGVSMYLPFNDGAEGDLRNPLALKNVLDLARKKLLTDGVKEQSVMVLLAPAYKLVEDEAFWRKSFETLAIFVYDDEFLTYTLPIKTEEKLAISRYPLIIPILEDYLTDRKLYVLVLTAGGSRLFRFDKYSHLEVTPETLLETSKEHASYFQIERETNYHIKRAGTGRSKEGLISHGSDNTEQLDKQRATQYAHFVAEEVKKVVKDGLPLVIAGAKSGFLAPTFRETYGKKGIIDDYIQVETTPLDLPRLQNGAARIIEQMESKDEMQRTEAMTNLFGTGLEESNPEMSVKMAFEGRIDTLLVNNEKRVYGIMDVFNNTCETKVTDNPEDEDLTNIAVANVWSKDGKVMFVPGSSIDDKPMLASLRY